MDALADRATVALIVSVVAVVIAGLSFVTNYLRGRRRLTITRAERGIWARDDEKDQFLIAITNTGATKETIIKCGIRDARIDFPYQVDHLPLDLNASATLRIPIDFLIEKWPDELGAAAVVYVQTASGQRFTAPIAPSALLGAWMLAYREAKQKLGVK